MPKKIILTNTVSELQSNKDSAISAIGLTNVGASFRTIDSTRIITPTTIINHPLRLFKAKLSGDDLTDLVLSEIESSDKFDFGIREELVGKTRHKIAVLGSHLIDNNKKWETLVQGNIPVFDTQETFHYENIDFSQTLTAIESEFVFATVFKTVYDGRTYFNHYDAEFLNFASIVSELDLPSLMVVFSAFEKEQLNRERQINLQVGSVDNLKFDSMRLLTHEGKLNLDTSRITTPSNLKSFMSLHAVMDSPSTVASIVNKQRNVIFDSSTFKQDYEQIAKNAPVYNKIQVPMDDFGLIGKSLKANNLLYKLMIDLKDVINERGLIDFYREEVPFQREYYDLILPNQGGRPSFSERTYENATVAAKATLRSFDFLDFLIAQCNCLDDPLTDDCLLISDSQYFTELQKETKFSNKIVLNKRISKVFKEVEEIIESNKPTYKDVAENNSTYSEVLFYRIEKRAGTAANDSREQEVVQNFYITNSEEQDVFKLFDSQVLMDKRYTYNLFEYRLSIGLDYKYSDVLYSQQFATSDDCALLVDPEDPSTPVRPSDGFSLAILNTRNRVQAEVTEQPSLILYEIPITTQDLSCLPLPPYQPSSRFYVYPNIPNTLFIEADTETLDDGGLYTPLTATDRSYLTRLKESYGLLSDDVPNDNKVPLSNLEVRILHTEPSSLTDFENPDRIETFSLDGRFGKITKGTFQLFLDENQDHFIVIRVVDQMRVASSTETIYRVKVLSDEGFRSLDTSVFLPNKKDEDAIVSYRDFSNFLRIKVAEGQRLLDEALVSNTEVDADEYILSGLPKRDPNVLKDVFNKKFKFRITSKTSGKKVDLNFTFRTKKE